MPMQLSPIPWRSSIPNPVLETAESSSEPVAPKPERRRLKGIVAAASWAYLFVVVALWVFLRVAGDRWWFAAFFVFGPRWVVALPALLLVPTALLARRRSLWPLAASLGVVVGPIMGLCVPWHRLFTADKPAFHLRVMTCNSHGTAMDLQRMAALIDAVGADVVATQESNPDGRTLGAGRWYVLGDSELRVQSRYPIRQVAEIFRNGDGGWGSGNAVEYELTTPAGPVRLVDLHLASPHDALSSAVRLDSDAPAEVELNTVRRLSEAGDLAAVARQVGPGVVLCGDFNMPCDSEGYRWNRTSLGDAFSAGGWGFGWTYHHGGTAVRIDHILTGADWDCRRCWVGPAVGSPHRPLIADLTWKGR
jgi:vancomycin resistance protein VanJ